MTQYKILSQPIENASDLESEVEKYLREGWQLAGGLATRAYTMTIRPGVFSHECKLFQAVWKPGVIR